MRIEYHRLAGKRVVTRDGEAIGRVTDLVAEPRGERLFVTELLVGPSALIRRIASKRLWLFSLAPPRVVPWELVQRVDDRVQLSVTAAELDQQARTEAERRNERLPLAESRR
jgi:sporulation protein YlmC with PRC-barrel domain